MTRSLLVLAALLLLGGCNRPSSNKISDSAIEAEVDKFHQHFNRGDDDAILREADQILRSSEDSKIAFFAVITLIRDSNGSAKKTEMIFHREVKYPDYGLCANVVMATQFKNGEAFEKFVYCLDGTDLKLAGYQTKERLGEDDTNW